MKIITRLHQNKIDTEICESKDTVTTHRNDTTMQSCNPHANKCGLLWYKKGHLRPKHTRLHTRAREHQIYNSNEIRISHPIRQHAPSAQMVVFLCNKIDHCFTQWLISYLRVSSICPLLVMRIKRQLNL